MATKPMTMRALLEAGVHFGHLARSRNPKMAEYIYGVKNKVNIINLEETLPLFNAAMKQVKQIANRGGRVLFVATKPQASRLVKEYAESCGMPYVNYRWLGGMLTNYKTIKQSIRRLKSLEKMQKSEEYKIITKRERLDIVRTLDKLENSLGGIKDMGGLPDALFVIDVGNENIAVKEANTLRIPVIGVVDTNSDPAGVNHIIPGNDDALRSIKLYLETAANLINEVKEERKAEALAVNKFKEEFVEVDEKEAKETTKVVKKAKSKPEAIEVETKAEAESSEAKAEQSTDKSSDTE